MSRQPRKRRKPGLSRRVLGALGPGLVTGASDDDPSGIGTYAQAGASLGFASLWTALVTFPMMWAVQFMCAKIGLVTGVGLARIIRTHYPRYVWYPVIVGLVIANTINAGVDIGAIAAAINLVIPIRPTVLIIPIAAVILIVQIWGSYRLLAMIFKWLTLALFSYILAAFFARPQWSAVLRGTFIPTIRFDRSFLLILMAVLGTTITPYLFFWQADQEVEEQISMGRRTLRQRQGATVAELATANWDVAAGMCLSNVVMYFIMLSTASTLFTAGQREIQTATQAARALEPLAGRAAALLWAPGLIGAGVLCVPILTGSAAYAVAEALGWRYGLDQRPARAKLFYGVITVSTLVGMAINFLDIDTMTALVWTAVINGLIAPPILVLVMLITNNRHILGTRVNGVLLNAVGWSATLAMCVAAVALIISFAR